MAKKQVKISSGALFISLLIVGIVLLLLPQNFTQKCNYLFNNLFKNVLDIGRKTTSARFKIISSSKENEVSQTKYNKLWQHYQNLYADFLELQAQFEKLAKIRTGLPKPGPALAIAHVNSLPAGNKHELIINRGTDDGIQEGQYVLSEERSCIIGTIKETFKATSRVRLLTDTRQSIKVQIVGREKNDILALMTGDGKKACKINMLSRDKKIRQGDVVFAAKQTGYLDTPRVIGEITELKYNENEPLLWDVTVTPIQDATELEWVAVIINEIPNSEEWDKR